jgi:transposase
MEAIPMVMRERIIALYAQNKSTQEISEALGYCPAAVRRVRQHLRERGTLVPQTHLCGAKGNFTPERQARVRELLAQKPDRTLEELCRHMDLRVAISTMDVWVRKLGFTFKKSPSGPPNRIVPTSPWRGRTGTRR